MKRSAFSPHSGVFIQHLICKGQHNMPVQHYHDAYEIYLQLAGKRYIFYENECFTLERGDVLICAPFELHYAESRESHFYERYVVNFQHKDLRLILRESESDLLLNQLVYGVYHFSEEDTKQILILLQRLEEYSLWDGILKEQLVSSALLPLLLYLAKRMKYHKEETGTRLPSLVSDGIRYLSRNYQKEITLNQVAKEVGVSKYYFCHVFKETTGATVLEYLNNIRLIKVHSLLLDTDESIEDIAICTGFSSSAHLNRIFKGIYGVSPRSFRKMNSNI